MVRFLGRCLMWSSNGPNILHNCFQFSTVRIVFGIRDEFFLASFVLCGEKNHHDFFVCLIHLHSVPKNIALRIAVCLPCQECFIWFLFRENPHTANFQLPRVPQTCLQILKLYFSPNTFNTYVGLYRGVRKMKWGAS